MIVEQPVIEFLALETYDGADWQPWTASLREINIDRGGKQDGVTTSVSTGLLSATLVNAGDPLTDESLKPNLPVRLRSVLSDEPVFTGSLVDIDTAYGLDKRSGKLSTFVTITAVDAVAAHSNITVFGAVTDGGIGYESWALRIERLAASATTDVTLPDDDAPVVRYAIG